MASVTAQLLKGSPPIQSDTAPEHEITDAEHDHGLARFFYAAAAALILSAIQGVVQRLPGISDWLTDADYGGHMVTNLAHTHITIVGAGTISLTGLIYYVLPRVTHRPIYSKALSNLSFWATITGVFGFYLSMLSIGLYEGAMVHAGWPYDAARDYLGAWHKAPMAFTAAIMGIGYWTFVANVYATVFKAGGERLAKLPGAVNDHDFLLAKFFAVGATGLLFGTIQGVYQVMPWSLDWLHATGDAGALIDPMAHAHMNLVGGVSIGLMGLFYYFLPKMLGRPIFSLKLGQFSFYCVVIGVFAFYFSAIFLGWTEGERVLSGFTQEEAKESMGIWHPLLLGIAGSIMGLGFWSFVANLLLTLRQKPAPDAPADRKLRFFIGFSAVAILAGTIQGVIQVLGPVEEWLEEALPSSYYLTPLAHAQLNMVGFAIISLMTMSLFLLPRILGKEVVDPAAGRRALTVMAVGIVMTYIAYATIGLLESIAIHNGATAEQARYTVFGPWGRYIGFIVAQGVLGTGYIMLFRHISRTIGREEIRAFYRTFWGRMRDAGKLGVRVHPRALPTTPGEAQRRALGGFFVEAIGFLGFGWFVSGRPFMAVILMSGWVSFLTILYVVIAILGNANLFVILMVPYFLICVLSGIGCYRSYMRDARAQLAGTL